MESPVRLTRRGRVVVLAALVAALGGQFALASQPGQAADPAGSPRVAVVQPGDTLWSIAGRYEPGRDRFDTIDEIRRLNRLGDYTVHAGQQLVLPAHR